MKAKSIKGKSPVDIKSALAECMSDGFKPTLAFVFISIKQDIDAVRTFLEEQNIRIFGATTGGEFINGDIGAGTIAILLVDPDPSNFMILLEDYTNKDPELVAKEMAEKAREQFKNPSFIISNSFEVAHVNQMGEPIVRAIETVCGDMV